MVVDGLVGGGGSVCCALVLTTLVFGGVFGGCGLVVGLVLICDCVLSV